MLPVLPAIQPSQSFQLVKVNKHLECDGPFIQLFLCLQELNGQVALTPKLMIIISLYRYLTHQLLPALPLTVASI